MNKRGGKTLCRRKVGSLILMLPTPRSSRTAVGIINYPLKYTVEVLSTGMRPREKGKSRDPGDLQTLNPWPKSRAPPRELSEKPGANITFGLLSP